MQSIKLKLAFALYIFVTVSTLCTLNAQFNSSLILGFDLYQRYTNPKGSATGVDLSSGAALFAIPIGVQFGYDKENIGIALEVSANLAPFALDLQEFKGLGALSFPFLLKGNFGALTGVSPAKLIGYSIGIGVQLNRTELFGLEKSFENLERSFFSTFVAEIAAGGGVGGFCLYFFTRIGVGENQSLSLNLGLATKTRLFKNKQTTQKPNFQS